MACARWHEGLEPLRSGLGPTLGEEPHVYGYVDPVGAALAFRRILEERWPREEGESGEAWFARVYQRYREGLWDPSAPRQLYRRLPVFEPLGERPRLEDLTGLARAAGPREGADA